MKALALCLMIILFVFGFRNICKNNKLIDDIIYSVCIGISVAITLLIFGVIR